jgi:hypothetical protein
LRVSSTKRTPKEEILDKIMLMITKHCSSVIITDQYEIKDGSEW